MKSCGKRSMFRRTAWTSTFVGTPYNAARSASSITLCARTNRMRSSMCSAGIDSGFMSGRPMNARPVEMLTGSGLQPRGVGRGFSTRRNDAADFAGVGVAIRTGLESPPGLAEEEEETMSRKDPGPKADRRRFLTGVVAAGAATAMAPARSTDLVAQAPRAPSALPPSGKAAEAETGTPRELARVKGTPGSDFMVDVIKTLDIKYLPANCASSYRAIHESLINYGGNKMPEFLTCMHEESAVGMAHGYFKVAGKPLMTLCHGTVGLRHATMGIYNAGCDRLPVIVVGGNDMDASTQTSGD